jgi:hypothetical protein
MVGLPLYKLWVVIETRLKPILVALTILARRISMLKRYASDKLQRTDHIISSGIPTQDRP